MCVQEIGVERHSSLGGVVVVLAVNQAGAFVWCDVWLLFHLCPFFSQGQRGHFNHLSSA